MRPARYRVDFLRVSEPVVNSIRKRFCRQTSQEVCPWNVKLAQELSEGSAFAARAMFVDKDTRTLARELLAMDQADYAAGFKGSAMKRAKLHGLRRNAAVVLGNVGTVDDLAVLEAMRLHEHEVVREHAAWALAVLGSSSD